MYKDKTKLDEIDGNWLKQFREPFNIRYKIIR